MPYPLSLDLQVKQKLSLKQTQRMIMSPQMQQAISLLQMPVLELSTVVEEALQQNPMMEFTEGERDTTDEDQSEEDSDNTDIVPEKELVFQENDFEILKKLDEEFRDQFSESDHSFNHSHDEKKLKDFVFVI